MAKPSSKQIQPITSARPIQHLAESRARPGVLSFFRLIAPLYIHAILGFRSVTLRNSERLVDAYDDFFTGKTRLLIAFRHPYGDEAQVLGYAIGRLLGREARRRYASRGCRWRRRPHAHFIHGYEVPLWAGAFERWLLPRVGAVPVYHTKFDAKSIERIRSLAKDGEFPIALAPEGQVSYVSEELPRLESGAAQIGAWCVHDLEKEGRPEKVVILPISVHHRWDKGAEKSLDRLIGRIEAECGVQPGSGESAPGGAAPDGAAPPVAGRPEPKNAGRFEWLSAAADAILATAERHYSRFCGASLPRPGSSTRAQRLEDLREAALTAAERAFDLKPDGDTIRRVYKIRQTGWDRIFREDIPDPAALPGLERGLADRAAGEAWYASRHMELVDLAWYLDFDRLKKDDPLELYIETAQNYWDLISRLEGGNLSNRIAIRGKRAILVVGEPIPVTERLAAFGSQRKAAVESLNEELKRSFIACIEEIREDRKNG